MDIDYTLLKFETTYSKEFEDSGGPEAIKIQIIGLDEEDKEIILGKAEVYLYNSEWVHFEMNDGYDDSRSEVFKSINFISYINDSEPYFHDYHENTVEVEMSYDYIALIHRFSIDEKFRGRGFGSKAFLDLLFFLKDKTTASWVLLKPYPLNWMGIEIDQTNEFMFLKDLRRVCKFYEKFDLKYTYGKLKKPAMYLDLYKSELLDV